MFKVRMQGQYGNLLDKRLRVVAWGMSAEWGFQKGIMHSYWVRLTFFLSFFLFGLSPMGNLPQPTTDGHNRQPTTTNHAGHSPPLTTTTTDYDDN
jgi:hypothetical protein